MADFLFQILIGSLERFFGGQLMAYLEKYHQEQKARENANSPQTKAEEIADYGHW